MYVQTVSKRTNIFVWKSGKSLKQFKFDSSTMFVERMSGKRKGLYDVCLADRFVIVSIQQTIRGESPSPIQALFHR